MYVWGSRYLEFIRNEYDILDNETPKIPDRNRPDNESPNQGSRYPEFRLTRPYCSFRLQPLIYFADYNSYNLTCLGTIKMHPTC